MRRLLPGCRLTGLAENSSCSVYDRASARCDFDQVLGLAVDFVLLTSRWNFGGTCNEDRNWWIVCAPPRSDNARTALTSASSCESLSSLALPKTSITLAQVVPAGQLPTFCRVTATLTPSSDSDIKIEIWLPIADWNGKFEPSATGAGREPSPTTGWPRHCKRVTRRHRPTRDTSVEMPCSRSDIQKRS